MASSIEWALLLATTVAGATAGLRVAGDRVRSGALAEAGCIDQLQASSACIAKSAADAAAEADGAEERRDARFGKRDGIWSDVAALAGGEMQQAKRAGRAPGGAELGEPMSKSEPAADEASEASPNDFFAERCEMAPDDAGGACGGPPPAAPAIGDVTAMPVLTNCGPPKPVDPADPCANVVPREGCFVSPHGWITVVSMSCDAELCWFTRVDIQPGGIVIVTSGRISARCPKLDLMSCPDEAIDGYYATTSTFSSTEEFAAGLPSGVQLTDCTGDTEPEDCSTNIVFDGKGLYPGARMSEVYIDSERGRIGLVDCGMDDVEAASRCTYGVQGWQVMKRTWSEVAGSQMGGPTTVSTGPKVVVIRDEGTALVPTGDPAAPTLPRDCVCAAGAGGQACLY